MEHITNFFTENIDTSLLFIIILGSYFIVKYTREYTKLKNVYKVFLASLIFATIFYFMDDCNGECAKRYMFTYLVATSFYELIVKWAIAKVESVFKISKE